MDTGTNSSYWTVSNFKKTLLKKGIFKVTRSIISLCVLVVKRLVAMHPIPHSPNTNTALGNER